jgi:hypothetical protein
MELYDERMEIEVQISKVNLYCRTADEYGGAAFVAKLLIMNLITLSLYGQYNNRNYSVAVIRFIKIFRQRGLYSRLYQNI